MLERARKNLEMAGFFDEGSDYGGKLGHAVMKLMEAHCNQGHSGMLAARSVQLFEYVANDRPLTGKYWDWAFEEMLKFATENNQGDWSMERHRHTYGERPKVGDVTVEAPAPEQTI